MAGERRRLPRDALHHAAVAAQRVHVVPEQVETRTVELPGHPTAGDRHADTGRHPLSQRAGRRLHAGGPAVFGVAGRLAVELTEALDVVEREGELAQPLVLGDVAVHATTDRPTLIIVDSHIAYGAPNKQDTSAAHGEPLGEEEIRLTKRTYDWPEAARFLVPDGVREHVASGVGKRGRALRDAWFAAVEEYRRAYPELADQVYRIQHRQLPEGWDRDLPSFPADPKGLAGRDASAQVLNVLARNVPWLIGGSAGLAPSTKTRRSEEHTSELQSPCNLVFRLLLEKKKK